MSPEQHDYEILCTKRRNAAFTLVGCVSACLHIAQTFNEPVDAKALQIALDKYNAADRELDAFKFGERIGVLEVNK